MIGFDERDPRLALLRNAYHARAYFSRLYAVHWEDGADAAHRIEDRLLAAEVSLL
jgi:hypothetical protein